MSLVALEGPLTLELAKPTLVHNGKSYTKGCSVKQSLADGGYLYFSYGHAYLVPAQQGTLDIDWKAVYQIAD